MTPIEILAAKSPDRKVRLYFRNAQGTATGVFETTAAHAANPNKSQRFFPTPDPTAPSGYKSPADMGWPVPYWYAEECYQVVLL